MANKILSDQKTVISSFVHAYLNSLPKMLSQSTKVFKVFMYSEQNSKQNSIYNMNCIPRASRNNFSKIRFSKELLFFLLSLIFDCGIIQSIYEAASIVDFIL